MGILNMNSNIRTIPLNEFDAEFSKLLSNKTSFLAYFYGGYDENGVSWCSDCVTSRPIIEEASKLLDGQDKITMIRVSVDDRNEWKKPDFVLRTYPKLKLDRVPTLLYYQGGVEFARLYEDQLFDLENVKEFFIQALE